MTASSLTLSTSLQYVKGIGPARADVLAHYNLHTVEDLLYYFPRRHLDRSTVTPLRSLTKDAEVTVIGSVIAADERRTRRGKLFQAILSDNTGNVTLTWFRGIHYIKQSVKKGDRLAVHGKVDVFNGFQIVHPEYDKLDTDTDPLSTGGIITLYPLAKDLKKVGLDHRRLRRIIREIQTGLERIPDFLPQEILQEFHLISLNQALQWIHFAEESNALKQAIHRLKFDEHFFLQLLMAVRHSAATQTQTRALDATGPYVKAIYDTLNFELTDAQKRVLKKIRSDLARGTTMNCLLQGDVGSGKTVVALLAAAIAIGNGTQVVVMAPTEILAHQHYQVFSHYAQKSKITCAILVGNMPAAERKRTLKALEEGRIQLIVGTHALIQEDVSFKELGLVIVDEQHRFGVDQRGELMSKGYHPHVLMMTATPIPRTLAMTYHGDMDVSVIDELPNHRQPVITKVVQPTRLSNVYQFIKKEVSRGRQVMVVYPLVEETEKSDLAAATEAYEQLTGTVFKELSVGLIHGRMKKDEKDAVMDAFSGNEIQVVVSTTVIEVGIDVPNATVMLIEHAERFGLTQLHQLRGRVGRGSEKSYCILVQRNHTETGQSRLSIMEKTSDGFKIADEDMRLRGPGEFFGTRQSGFISFKLANLVTDGPLIRQARQVAFNIIRDDPHLRQKTHAEIRRRFMEHYRDKLEYAGIG